MAELVAAQNHYQSLLANEKDRVTTAKKQKVEEAAKEMARKEGAKAEILEAKSRLDKVMGKNSA